MTTSRIEKCIILVGLPSPSGRAQKAAEAGLHRSQTIGQRIMGNMMDNLFLRSLTSKSKSRVSDASAPPSPPKVFFLCISAFSLLGLESNSRSTQQNKSLLISQVDVILDLNKLLSIILDPSYFIF